MFEQVFKNIDDKLWKDAGCSSELDYVEQTSWILFLKYLDDLEKTKAKEARLSGKTYAPIINEEFQWETWAAPKDAEGNLDHHKALTGDDLRDFVDQKLFPYLKKFKLSAESPNTIEYKIGEIFSELKNKIQSGYNMREIINKIDELRFQSHKEKHELSHLYEGKIQNMGNAGRNGGEYYTPRPLIRSIVKVVDPNIGETVYDGAVGSAGFLVEAFEHMSESKDLTTKDVETLQTKTFYGKEKKSLAYIIGIMNMILHGIEAPNIVHTNTLSENITDIQEKDRYDVVLANPPFGGKERSEVQENFPIKTSETAMLFLQHFIKILKAGGRGGVVIKSTFLSNMDNASVNLRKHLLNTCNLHTILLLPSGAFLTTGVQTVVLFFEKGSPTKDVWFYELNLKRNLGKTSPLNEEDLKDFLLLQKTKVKSLNSWSLSKKAILENNYDLSPRNPNRNTSATLRKPQEIIQEIKILENNSIELLQQVQEISITEEQNVRQLGEICDIVGGGTPSKRNNEFYGGTIPWATVGDMTSDHLIETKLSITLDAVDKSSTNIIPSGNVIIATRVGLGKVCILDQDTAINQDLKAIIPKDKNYLSVEYLFRWFQSISNQIIQEGTGATVKGVKLSFVRTLKIPVPSLSEQNRIVTNLDRSLTALSRINELADKKKSTVDELRNTLLKGAFGSEEGDHIE